MKKQYEELTLEGLNCAMCAAAIEKKVSKLDGVKSATMDFIGTALFLIGVLFKFSKPVEFTLYFLSYTLIGGGVLLQSVRNIGKGRLFDENFLMSLATIGAFSIGEFPEGVAVMLFYRIGEYFQESAVKRSRRSIRELMDIRPDFAYLKGEGGIVRVPPEKVRAGDIIIIKPGDKVPLDGRIIEGTAYLDTSALTGESIPRDAGVGDEILAGFVNKSGVLMVEVTKEFGDTTVSKILELIQNSSSRKAPTENFITRFAGYYTPAVVFLALFIALLPPLLLPGAAFSDWLYRALVFLVISCPCALVISIPLGFFGGIGGASGKGILVKGSNYLEALNHVDTVVFDKTGTLTKGVFKVASIKPAADLNEGELLEYAAYAESYSNHPIARSIMEGYSGIIDQNRIEGYEELTGLGIISLVSGKTVLAGNKKLLEREGIVCEVVEEPGTVVYIAVGGKYAGHIIISDEIKEDAARAIRELREMGVKKLVMLTGDRKAVAQRVGSILGLDEVYSELLPDMKVEKFEEIERNKTSGGKLIFVGDGINDAPVLARADIGIAMGGLGSDAAMEAADVVIMTDEPSKIPQAIRIARKTKGIVWQNIWLSFAVKVFILILGAGGLATMWEAVFADVGVALIAVLNSMRGLKW